MAEVLYKLPPVAVKPTTPDGYWTPEWYRYFQEDRRRVGGDVDKVEAAYQAASGAAGVSIVSTVDGTYGHQTAVPVVTISGDTIRVQQRNITGLVNVQSGWPAYTAATVSAAYVQAEVQSIADDLESLVNALRSAGVLED